MGIRNWVKGTLILAGACLVALPAVAQQQSSQQQSGDPVAEAARRTREQQKTQPKPKKVYTEDDIPSRIPAAPQPATQTGSDNQQGAQPAQGAQGAAGTEASSSGLQDAEKMWRKRFADQRAKIATAEKELDILQRESDKAQTQYYSDPQKALMEQNTRKEINEKNAKIDQKKQEIANLKQQLSDLEDELRKAGGDSGWARE